MILRLNNGTGCGARAEAATAQHCPCRAWLYFRTRLIISTEPADDTALQNGQRRERRLQHVPYYGQPSGGAFIGGERLRQWCLACPLASRTMKQASVSSTDRGGGKRRTQGLKRSALSSRAAQRQNAPPATPEAARAVLRGVVLSEQQLREVGDVGGDAARLVAGEEMRRRASPGSSSGRNMRSHLNTPATIRASPARGDARPDRGNRCSRRRAAIWCGLRLRCPRP